MIFMCNPEMKHCLNVLDGDSDVHPRGMALDPTKGFLFYTTWGLGPAGLIRANLDGSNKTVLANYKVVYPYGITLDLANQHVYWVDSYLNFVERVDYFGRNRQSMKRVIDVSLL